MRMTYFITITSQGQLSIPASIRKQLSLDKVKKATLEMRDNKIIIEPIKDIIALRGVFKTDKKIPFKKARQAFEQAVATDNI